MTIRKVTYQDMYDTIESLCFTNSITEVIDVLANYCELMAAEALNDAEKSMYAAVAGRLYAAYDTSNALIE